MWPTAEQRAASKKSTTKKATNTTTKKTPTPKPATKTTPIKKSPSKIVKLPKETKKVPSITKKEILPLKPSSTTYRGSATLGTKKVHSSPTFQHLLVNGKSYVLVPAAESSQDSLAETAKADGIIAKLREIRNELFGLGSGSGKFNLAGRQVGIAIELLKRGEDCGGEEGREEEEKEEEKPACIDVCDSEEEKRDELDSVVICGRGTLKKLKDEEEKKFGKVTTTRFEKDEEEEEEEEGRLRSGGGCVHGRKVHGEEGVYGKEEDEMGFGDY